MNAVFGRLALGHVRKLPNILATLRHKKAALKEMLTGLPHFRFRRINDEEGECATMLTLIFDTKELAERFGAAVCAKPLSNSGWHCYNNMEQILNQVTATHAGCPISAKRYPSGVTYRKHMLPQTDDILEAPSTQRGRGGCWHRREYGINICPPTTRFALSARILPHHTVALNRRGRPRAAAGPFPAAAYRKA
jgi:hypothetical protein